MSRYYSYEDYLNRKRAEHGERFDPSDLAEQFIPYFISRERIRVEGLADEPLTGTVGVTTGHKPAFLLMRRSSDHGSMWLLSDEHRITAVKRGRDYVAVS